MHVKLESNRVVLRTTSNYTCEIYYEARQSFTENNISLSLLSWKRTKISCLMAGVTVNLLLNIVFESVRTRSKENTASSNVLTKGEVTI